MIRSTRRWLTRSRRRRRTVNALLAAGAAGGAVMVNPGWAFPLGAALAAAALALGASGPGDHEGGG
jgi:hypothetical protein